MPTKQVVQHVLPVLAIHHLLVQQVVLPVQLHQIRNMYQQHVLQQRIHNLVIVCQQVLVNTNQRHVLKVMRALQVVVVV